MEKFKIVVVDDEEDVCLLMKKVLEKTDLYTVFPTFNIAEGEAACIRERPQLIFLDYIMPDGTGDKLIAKLKEKPETKNIPIVLMSGLGEMKYFDDKEKWRWVPNTKVVLNRPELPESLQWHKSSDEVAQELGVTIYLRKPFSKETLLDIAAAIMENNKKNQKKEDV